MQFLSLSINSSLQNNPRYQFSLKSENIEILPILSADILRNGGHSLAICFGQNILPTLLNIYFQFYHHAKSCGNPVSDISEVIVLTYVHGFHGNGGQFENSKTWWHLLRWGSTFLWSLVKIGSSVSENLVGQVHGEKRRKE